MKMKFVKGIVAAVIITAVAIPSLLLWNVYEDAKDYKQALTVQEDKRQPLKAGADTNEPSGESTTKAGVLVQPVDTAQSDSTRSTSLNDMPDGTLKEEIQGQFDDINVIDVLFLGIDRDEERDKTLGIYRTDTIALTRINLDTKEVKVLCIPRDTYAYLPITDKMDKINHAYAFGSLKGKGVESTIEAVEKFVKYAKVDYYFLIDMEPVPEIVDTLGGVELDVDVDIRGYGTDIKKGKQVLDGKQALAYIRWRYSGNGDIDRIKRQQKLLKAVYEKLRETGQMANAIKIVLKYNKSVKTDMSLKQLLALALLSKDVTGDSVKTEIIPGEDRIISKIWYYIPDEKGTEAMLKKMYGK